VVRKLQFFGSAAYCPGRDGVKLRLPLVPVIGQKRERDVHRAAPAGHAHEIRAPAHRALPGGGGQLDEGDADVVDLDRGHALQSHAVEMLREHIYPGNPPNAANTINYTFVTCGPEIPSVVPDYTTAWYTGRFATTEEMINAIERITKCAQAGALATETEVKREIITMTHHKIPNKTLASCLRANFIENGLPDFSEEEHAKAREIQKSFGVEEVGMHTELLPFMGGWTGLCDTSEYSWNAPYATAWIAMAPYGCSWHNWCVARSSGDTTGKKALDSAAGALAMTAIDRLCDGQLLQDAKAEWQERMGGDKYESLLEADMKPPVDMNRDLMEKYHSTADNLA